jgi:mRNA-degrading endonuclease RelE of RelBE toxin-antitoxin system
MSTKEKPLHYFDRLTKRPGYKLRIGNYRAIADINEKTKTIIILLIRHRKNIYKKYS